jgi:hypothetical protein
MPNKLFRLLVKDPQFILRLILLLFCIGALVLLVKKEKAQKAEVVKVKEQKQLVAMIPKMETRIKAEQVKVQESIQKVAAKESKLVLNGIFYDSHRKVAIVNGQICHEGDVVSNFTVLQITPRAVLMKDAQSDRIVHLSL